MMTRPAGIPTTPSQTARILFACMSLAVLAGCQPDAGKPADQAPMADAAASAMPDPEATYQARCAQCHDQAFPKAPHRVTFQMMGRDAIYSALSTGLMRTNAAGLDDDELQALADHLGGSGRPGIPPRACTSDAVSPTLQDPLPLQGWSLTLTGTRYVDAATARLAKADVKNLKLKWAFAYPGATRARSQPSYFAGSILVGSQDGTVYALDLDSGCMRWRFKAAAEVRSAISVKAASGDQPATAFFGAIKGMVYAVNATDGSLLWQTRAGDHPAVTLTRSPRLY